MIYYKVHETGDENLEALMVEANQKGKGDLETEKKIKNIC